MTQRGGRSPAGLGFSRRGDRERLLFIASAGLAFSLLVITLVVLNYRTAVGTRIEASPEVPAEQMIGTMSVLTVDKAIAAGTKLTGLEVRESFWRRDQVPNGAVLDRNELKDKYAKADIPAGQVVTRENLTANPIETSLPLTPGFRAVSIECDAVTCLEGHSLPGTRVDVMLTYYEEQKLTTKLVVENARVLSYAGKSERAPGERGPRAEVGRTITLEVVPQDALKIRTASQLGKLSLTMRSLDDAKGSEVREFTSTQLGDPDEARKNQRKCTNKGRIRIGGQEFEMDCDGQIRQVVGLDE